MGEGHTGRGRKELKECPPAGQAGPSEREKSGWKRQEPSRCCGALGEDSLRPHLWKAGCKPASLPTNFQAAGRGPGVPGPDAQDASDLNSEA